MNKITTYIIITLLIFPAILSAQMTIENQIKELPKIYSEYVGNYTHDFTAYQGASNLLNLNTTGRVLDKWNFSISINTTVAMIPSVSENSSLIKYPNLYTNGTIPTMFSGTQKGSMSFLLLNETSGTPLFDPFTGETIGAELPVFDGIDAGGYAASAALIPKLSLGVGFGTEISGMFLPGIFKSSTKSNSSGIYVGSDNTLLLGLKHDLFHWIPSLHKNNYFLSVGVSYFNLNVDLKGLDTKFATSNVNSPYFKATFDLRGATYSSKAIGIDLMATKSFNWVDLSIFGMYSKAESSIVSDGTINVQYATDFVSASPVLKSTTLDNLVNTSNSNKRFAYGAAVQFNIMRMRLGFKYGYYDEAYGTVSLGFVIGKKPKPEDK